MKVAHFTVNNIIHKLAKLGLYADIKGWAQHISKKMNPTEPEKALKEMTSEEYQDYKKRLDKE